MPSLSSTRSLPAFRERPIDVVGLVRLKWLLRPSGAVTARAAQATAGTVPGSSSVEVDAGDGGQVVGPHPGFGTPLTALGTARAGLAGASRLCLDGLSRPSRSGP